MSKRIFWVVSAGHGAVVMSLMASLPAPNRSLEWATDFKCSSDVFAFRTWLLRSTDLVGHHERLV